MVGEGTYWRHRLQYVPVFIGSSTWARTRELRIISAYLVWLPSRQPGPPRDSMEKCALFECTNSKHCLLVLKPHPPALRSVSQSRTTRLKKAFLGSWACGLPPVHSANRFAFHGRCKAPHTTTLGFRGALVAAVLTENRAPWLTKLGKTGLHA